MASPPAPYADSGTGFNNRPAPVVMSTGLPAAVLVAGLVQHAPSPSPRDTAITRGESSWAVAVASRTHTNSAVHTFMFFPIISLHSDLHGTNTAAKHVNDRLIKI